MLTTQKNLTTRLPRLRSVDEHRMPRCDAERKLGRRAAFATHTPEMHQDVERAMVSTVAIRL